MKLISVCFIAAVSAAAAARADMVYFDAARDFSKVSGEGASFELAGGGVKVSYGKKPRANAGIAITIPANVENFAQVSFDIDSPDGASLAAVLQNPVCDFDKQSGYAVFNIHTGADPVLDFDIAPMCDPEVYDIVKDSKKMRGNPFGIGNRSAFDRSKLAKLRIYMRAPAEGKTWTLRKVRFIDKANAKTPAYFSFGKSRFFPFIDKYGQFIHKTWRDKIESDADFAKMAKLEEADLAAHTGAKGLDKWGGWADGPTLRATGHFRVEKIGGKWWMVDPDGKLFWSHGAVRVTPHSGITPLDGRKFFFKELPAQDSAFAKFYHTHDELLRPYYVKRGIAETYDFSAANIMRKYGEGWEEKFAEICHRRLKSWGLNTIANSSDKRIFMMDKTPYIDRFEIKAPALEGSDGYWWQFRDPFNPEFAKNVRKNLQERAGELADPYCIGIFVDNELNWGKPDSHAIWTLTSSENCVAKRVFASDLKNKYGAIENLNAVWGTSHSSWDGFMKSKELPPKGAYDDCVAFSMKLIEEYYRVVRNEVKFAAPHILYMGCRFAGIPKYNPQAIYIGAKYCDVISYNIYRDVLDEVRLPEGVDKPIMIGEFHFGSLDRGKFHPGLVYKKDQNARAQAYYDYVHSALRHPNVIGTHWHQFSDQATTGRFDGENFQVGFTDICDTPYWETIAKVREIGYKMYGVRSGREK